MWPGRWSRDSAFIRVFGVSRKGVSLGAVSVPADGIASLASASAVPMRLGTGPRQMKEQSYKAIPLC